MSAQTEASSLSSARPLSGVTTFRGASPWFIALLAFAIFAFWPPYFSRLFAIENATTHFHVMTMVIWCSLLIVQPWLIRTRRHALHRSLGKLSYALFPLLVIGFVALAHQRINSAEGPPPELRNYILYLQVEGLALFSISYLLAVLYRGSPMIHARLMICTGLVLLDPAIARIFIFRLDQMPPFPPQFVSYPLTDLIFLALIFLERKAVRGRAVFPAMLGLFAVVQVLTFVVTPQPFWAEFAHWFAAL